MALDLTRDINVNNQYMKIQDQESLSYEMIEVLDIFRTTNPEILENRHIDGLVKRVLVFVDHEVYKEHELQLHSYFANFNVSAEYSVLECGENIKEIENLIQVLNTINDFDIDRRNEQIVAIGGGTLLDLIGFAAAVYRRGVPFVRVPTSLMGLIDAGIGVKTAINWNGKKNLIGAYAAPERVVLDYSFLKTLPMRHWANGMAEIIKLGICKDLTLFEMLENVPVTQDPCGRLSRSYLMIYRKSIDCMLNELYGNLTEKNLYRLVDFGHWLSPVIELESKNLLHGEAVAIDMAITCSIAHRRQLLSEDALLRVLNILKKFNLPFVHPILSEITIEKALRSVEKHRAGSQKIPVPIKFGKCVFLDDISVSEVLASSQNIFNIFQKNEGNKNEKKIDS